MALSKVTYVDGKTIITAANLNAIQDEIISQESRKSEKTATVSNITYDETTGKFRKTINGATSDIIVVDSSPTSGSKKPVQSGGVYTALATLTNSLNSVMLIAPAYTGATDLDSVCDYIKSLISNNPAKYANKMFSFLVSHQSGQATGYFGASSFSVLCKYSSANYGYGIMMSYASQNIAAFRTDNSRNAIYKVGDLEGEINTLQSAVTINNSNSLTSYAQLNGLTGDILQNVSGKLTGNIMFVSGRARVSITARTAPNGGIRYTLPDNKRIDGSFNNMCGVSSYSDGLRAGEATLILGNDGQTYFNVLASESYANLQAGKTIVFYIPPTIIKVK